MARNPRSGGARKADFSAGAVQKRCAQFVAVADRYLKRADELRGVREAIARRFARDRAIEGKHVSLLTGRRSRADLEHGKQLQAAVETLEQGQERDGQKLELLARWLVLASIQWRIDAQAFVEWIGPNVNDADLKRARARAVLLDQLSRQLPARRSSIPKTRATRAAGSEDRHPRKLTPKQIAAMSHLVNHGSYAKGAEAMGVTKSTFHGLIERAKLRSPEVRGTIIALKRPRTHSIPLGSRGELLIDSDARRDF